MRLVITGLEYTGKTSLTMKIVEMIEAATGKKSPYHDHYWPKIVEEGYASLYSRARHFAYARALQITYKVAISYFLIGGVILVYAVIGLLHKQHPPRSPHV